MLDRCAVAPGDLRQRHGLELVKRQAAVGQVGAEAGNAHRTLLRRLGPAPAAAFSIRAVAGSMRFGQAISAPKTAREIGD